jgi:hypothetical protein
LIEVGLGFGPGDPFDRVIDEPVMMCRPIAIGTQLTVGPGVI